MVSHDLRAGHCCIFLIRDLEEICGHCFCGSRSVDTVLICERSVVAVFVDLLEIYAMRVRAVYCGRARRYLLRS